MCDKVFSQLGEVKDGAIREYTKVHLNQINTHLLSFENTIIQETKAYIARNKKKKAEDKKKKENKYSPWKQMLLKVKGG
jgi:hypothetical protein